MSKNTGAGEGAGLNLQCSLKADVSFRERCAYCHDALSAQPSVSCASCATRLHVECVANSGKCPTLGCKTRFPRRVRPRRRISLAPRGEGVVTLWRQFFRFLGGVGLPVLCFVMNEAGFGEFLTSSHIGLGSSLWSAAFSPEVQRFFYPLLAWAILAFLAHLRGRRGTWLTVGLICGVVLSGAFSVLFLPVLPLAVVGLVMLIGALGFCPYVACLSYVSALRRQYRSDLEAEGNKEAPQPTWGREWEAPVISWLVCFGITCTLAFQHAQQLQGSTWPPW